MTEQRAELSVSIVSHAPDTHGLSLTLDSLCRALRNSELERSHLYLIDNGPTGVRGRLEAMLDRLPLTPGSTVTLLSGHGNVGYGAGHNLAIGQSGYRYHLVLNPDVELQSDALREAVRFMNRHPDAGLLAPAVQDGAGRFQYLCRRHPGVLDLGLRGFAPEWLQRRFGRRLRHYEMRDVIGSSRMVWDVPLISGCFMLLRREVLEKTKGFDPGFFLYFEDYDLSLRAARFARTVYVPRVRIVHHGGHAARKGRHHIVYFMRSAARFYRKHGWAI